MYIYTLRVCVSVLINCFGKLLLFQRRKLINKYQKIQFRKCSDRMYKHVQKGYTYLFHCTFQHLLK